MYNQLKTKSMVVKSFSDMGVKLKRRFEGDRIRIEKVEGDEIIVHDYEIRESKIKRDDGEVGRCLYMQIELRGKRYVMWGNYKYLIEQISQIDLSELPFKSTIVNDHGYVFK